MYGSIYVAWFAFQVLPPVFCGNPVPIIAVSERHMSMRIFWKNKHNGIELDIRNLSRKNILEAPND
jgi:hypothetical protein